MEIKEGIPRVVAIVVTLLTLVSCQQTSTPTMVQHYWTDYTARFYQAGRIVDTGNDAVTHSESQGYGMLMAVAANDRERFDALWQWTQTHLQRADGLFSWRYRPCSSADKQCVDDPNNASDGEVLIAWALLRAAKEWQHSVYHDAALQIIALIKQHLVVERNGYLLLLPGIDGFQSEGSTQINLSYWIFPAFTDFAQVTQDAFWLQLNSSGYQLVREARFQPEQLNPDWVVLENGQFSLDKAVNQEFGFNAWRVPLHLIWQQNFDYALLIPYLQWWQAETIPATVNLVTGEHAEYGATWGMQAVKYAVERRALMTQLAVNKTADTHGSTEFSWPTATPSASYTANKMPDNVDYYSASLFMLALIARQDTQ